MEETVSAAGRAVRGGSKVSLWHKVEEQIAKLNPEVSGEVEKVPEELEILAKEISNCNVEEVKLLYLINCICI